MSGTINKVITRASLGATGRMATGYGPGKSLLREISRSA